MIVRRAGDFGSGKGELDPCAVAFALRRAEQRRRDAERRRAEREKRIEARRQFWRGWFGRRRPQAAG